MLDFRVFFKCEWFVLQGCLQHGLTGTRYEPDAVQALRDDIDLKNGQ